jgi:hypothetical protein
MAERPFHIKQIPGVVRLPQFSETPKTTRSMNQAIESLNLSHLWIIHPGEHAYPLSKQISAWPIKEILSLPKQLR